MKNFPRFLKMQLTTMIHGQTVQKGLRALVKQAAD